MSWERVLIAAWLVALSACASPESQQRHAPARDDRIQDTRPRKAARYVDAEAGDEAPHYTPADGDDGNDGFLAEVEAEEPPGDDMPSEDTPPEELPPEDNPDDDLASDPHTKRAGAREKAAPAPAPVVFRSPTGKAGTPVHRSRRPPEPPDAKLAVAFVREGLVVHRPAPLLELGSLLESEAGVSLVLALSHPAPAQVGLAALAAQARVEGRDLLLVDVRAGDERTGYLLDTERGVLLARYETGDRATPASGADAHLCERIGRTYAALEAD